MLSTFKFSEPLHTAIRAGIAICVAIAFVALFHLQFGYWLILTTIVVLQPTFGATLERAKKRTIGTLLGVAIGALLAVMINHTVAPTIIIVCFLVFLCVINIRISYAITIFLASTLLILLLSVHEPNTRQFVIMRVYDTIAGAGIGIITSFLLWPSWARLELNRNLSKTIQQADHLLMLVIDAILEQNTKAATINPIKLDLEKMIDSNRQFLQQSMQELTLANNKIAPAMALVVNLEKIQYILQTLHFICQTDFKPRYPEKLKQILIELRDNVHQVLEYSETLISGTHRHTDPIQHKQLFDRIKVLEELPQDRTPALRFLHRNMNLLITETNHLLHAALLVAQPKTAQSVRDQDHQQQQQQHRPGSEHSG